MLFTTPRLALGLSRFAARSLASAAPPAIVLLVALGTVSTEAALVVETRTNTNDIQVPRFNPALGTLQSVTLNVTMQSGSSTPAGAHAHADKTVLSTNDVNSNNYDPFTPFPIQSSASGGLHTHSFSTPAYSGGGLSLGSFAGLSTVEGSHNHQLIVSYDGFQGGIGDYNLRVNIEPSPSSQPYVHGVPSILKSLSFTGGSVAPFEGTSDLVIPAGSFSFDPSSSHTHNYAPFSIDLEESGPFGGTDTFNFSGGTLNFAGSHTHSFDPRFTVTATFNYAAIPEPSLVGAFALGTIALASRRRRRRA